MFNKSKLALPLIVVTTLLTVTSTAYAQQSSHGQNPYGYANNNAIPWGNSYGNNTPWNSSWMPWNMGNNNGYGNNTPWNSSWMPWNSNGNNNWGGMTGPMDSMMNGFSDADIAMDFNFKFSAKGNGNSNASSNGYNQANLSGQTYGYPQNTNR